MGHLYVVILCRVMLKVTVTWGNVVISTLYDMPGIDVTHPEIAAQWHPTKNGALLPADVTAGSHKKVWWRCPKTCPQGCPHEWESTIKNRCKGNGCPCCSQRAMSCEHISITHTHPKIASQWHPTKNGNLLPSQVTAGSHKKVWWRCPNTCPQGCPHEWATVISDRCLAGNKCPYCSNQIISCEHVSIVHTNSDIVAQWHPTKNGVLLPSQFTDGSGKKVWWRCPKTCPQGCLHEWEAVIASRCLAENGCPHCSQKTTTCEHVSIKHTHPAISAQWHPIKNGDLFPSQFTAGSNKKVWWKCAKTCSQGCPHEWLATIVSRCNGSGCPCCLNQKISCIHVSIAYTHPDIATQWHPMKNGDLLPSQFTAGSGKKVWWQCTKNPSHEWVTYIYSRCRGGTGCPHCVNKTEAKLHEYLKGQFSDTDTQFCALWCKSPTSNKHLPFDFYIPSLKLIIELDGAQHFRQVSNWQCHRKTAKRDVYKMQQAAAQGISMLRLVQEEVLDASHEWMDEHVKPHLIYHEPPIQTLLSVNSPDLYTDHLQLLADTDTISIEDSIGSEEGDKEIEEPDSEELVSSDDTE
jgi:hypothetical protein